MALEAALMHHNAARYRVAIEGYLSAARAWAEADGKLRADATVFILCAVGDVYDSAGLDELALCA
jgi:hypothetical protein